MPPRPHKLLRNAEGKLDAKSLNWPMFETFAASELGEGSERARKVFTALWQKGVRSFDEVPNVARTALKKFDEAMYIPFLEPELVLKSKDGTRKFLWKLEDGYTIESVLIPDGDRVTLCVSSQVGCAMACTFCLTGDLGLKRHLKPSEIAGQPMQVGRLLDEGQRITNIVMMGMGEPLHNLDNLCTALETCLDDKALNFSHRKITVSTVGLVPKMGELAERLPVNLAVSLNATTEERRREIMPITKKHSLAELIQACKDFPLPSGKRITFEYVMFRGDNDTLEDAARLYEMLKDIPTKLNLIPYNENPEREIQRPDQQWVEDFREYFVERGMNCTIRTTRGLDISAACGQLGKAWAQAMDRGWLEQARAMAGMGEAPSAGA